MQGGNERRGGEAALNFCSSDSLLIIDIRSDPVILSVQSHGSGFCELSVPFRSTGRPEVRLEGRYPSVMHGRHRTPDARIRPGDTVLLNTKKVGDKLIVYLEGRLDVSVSNDIEEELARLIDQEKEHHIILNMDRVEYMSSSGFRACIATLRKINAADGSLKLCNIRPSVKRIFDVIELTSLFDIYDTEGEALGS